MSRLVIRDQYINTLVRPILAALGDTPPPIERNITVVTDDGDILITQHEVGRYWRCDVTGLLTSTTIVKLLDGGITSSLTLARINKCISTCEYCGANHVVDKDVGIVPIPMKWCDACRLHVQNMVIENHTPLRSYQDEIAPVYGVEVEFVVSTADRDLFITNNANVVNVYLSMVNAALAEVYNTHGYRIPVWYKYDRSLNSCGIELNFQPMTMQYLMDHKAQFELFFRTLRSHGASAYLKDNEVAGIHIHRNIDKDDPTLLDIAHFEKHEREMLIDFGGRTNDIYNQYSSNIRNGSTHRGLYVKSGNYHTTEYRGFSSDMLFNKLDDTSPDTLVILIQHVECFHQYVTSKGEVTWKEFTKRTGYVEYNKFLDECMFTFNDTIATEYFNYSNTTYAANKLKKDMERWFAENNWMRGHSLFIHPNGIATCVSWSTSRMIPNNYIVIAKDGTRGEDLSDTNLIIPINADLSPVSIDCILTHPLCDHPFMTSLLEKYSCV